MPKHATNIFVLTFFSHSESNRKTQSSKAFTLLKICNECQGNNDSLSPYHEKSTTDESATGVCGKYT